MTSIKSIAGPGLALLITLGAISVQADVNPAALFTDNMVIQQQADAAIWGWADPGEEVVVTASWGSSATALTSSDGKWFLTLTTPAAKRGGAQSYTLSFKGNNRVEVENVLVGEVWLASGQSNMAFTIDMLKLDDEQLGNCDLPLIREYTVQKNPTPELAADTVGHWKIASKETIGNFSGTAWFFARTIHQSLNVPIGIINSSWGGTPIESWISKESQESHAATQQRIAEMDRWAANFSLEESQQRYEAALAKWEMDKAEAVRQNTEFKQRKPRLMTRSSRLHRYPGNLYAGMIHPLVPFSIKGTIWYQGEANSHSVEQAEFYQTQLTELITSWRNDWHDTEMPFYVVQLANYRSPQVDPVEHEQFWPVTRESMRKVTGSLAHTGMAVAIDIGDAENIHPKNKWELGRRLALLALHNDYGHKLVPSGPLFKSYSIEGDSILIDFDHKGAGLAAKGGTQLHGFAIAGDYGKYIWADAKIVTRSTGWKFWQKQQMIQVRSPLVSDPKSVKYGWADNPDTINLYNEEGLPASPFSTD